MPLPKQAVLKPQDIVICLKMHLGFDRQSISDLSKSLFISTGEVYGGIKRAELSRLIIVEGRMRRVSQTSLIEFIVHGLKYAFPASTGSSVRGFPTGIAAIAEINRRFAPTDALPYVWPDPEGPEVGIALAPLFPSVPKAIRTDSEMYKALALVDAIREGAARERELATDELRMMLAK